ncbi:hypothetical protein A2U01_0069711, partial [Trifolium medium]|nr:hypothetical protein [Trifolium medium]
MSEQQVSSGAVHAVSSSSKPAGSNTCSPVVSHKRSRLNTVIDLEVPDKKFMLPPCFSSGQIFVNDQTLSVSPAETAIIRDLGAASRKKVLAGDVA